ncbi:MAG: GreA/GreB family elongation factor [Bdellovibrionaceae bacterium]|nr:GreA/GreB family elongation factor [Pseudobdellovibrionaceae bacterium]
MDKVKLVEKIRTTLEKDLEVLREAARSTHEAATHEESKPENEYDTRGLEASYLAGAQSKRIIETEELLVIFKHAELKHFTDQDRISATALIEIEFKGKVGFYFLMPKGGGTSVTMDGTRIQVVTPNSPLGQALLGMKVGGTAIVENGTQMLEYDVLSIR